MFRKTQSTFQDCRSARFHEYQAADITSPEKPTKNSTRPHLNEIPRNFIHEIKTQGYDVIGFNVSTQKIQQLFFEIEVNSGCYIYRGAKRRGKYS